MTARDEALRHLKRQDPAFWSATKAWHKELPEALSKKRTRQQLFESLVSIVTSQQLGVKAADSIFRRVKEACEGALTPDSVLDASDQALREAGLSAAKVKTIKAIAQEIKQDTLDLISLSRDSGEAAHAALTSIWGLGPWSVEMFLMFSLGHPDIFSPGDLGLVRGVERIYGLSREKITRASLLSLAERWSPYRTWACLLLWRSRYTTPPPALAKGRHRSA